MTMLDRMHSARPLSPADHASIGHNNPPGPVEHARDATRELSGFLTEHPVIQDHAAAKLGGGYVERTRIALKSMEDERVELVAPHNQALDAINTPRRLVRDPLERILKELRKRLTAFAQAEEDKRAAAAEEARRTAEAAEKAAREAEAREQEAIANAAQGEMTTVGEAIAEADAAFDEFQRADRTAARAERSVPVRIGSVMGGRTLSMRTTEVLVVEDAVKAITALGVTDKIRDAILSSARDFRKAFDELPAGVASTYDRSM